MCICINCSFYNKCWIKNGIARIPKKFAQSIIKPISEIKSYNSKFLNKSLSIYIILNSFNQKKIFEFDVTECEAFCECPGEWIKI